MAEQKGRTAKRNNKKTSEAAGILMNVMLVLVATVIVLLGCLGASGGRLIEKQLFPSGTVIDDIDIGGLTYEEGLNKARANKQREIDDIFIELDCAGSLITLDSKDLGVTYDIGDTLLSYCYRDDGQRNLLFQGLNAVLGPHEGANIKTSISYDEDAIRASLVEKLTGYDKDPADAQASFVKETAMFTYTSERAGRRVDIDKALDDVLSALNSNDTRTINVDFFTLEPSVTSEALAKNSILVSEYSTVLTKSENRNTNIGLMCQAVDGLKLDPGETLSINALVGKRTADKGFKEAAAIVDGTFMEDLGGGICQLSGTLYNAALLADMEIVERKRHSYPSTYLPVGLDSTLNWDNKDLKIKNKSDYPMYISAKMDMEEMILTVKLFGQPLKEGLSIEIVPEVLREIKPGGQKIEFTTSLPAGKRKTVQAAQIGYEVKVYRNYFLNGELLSQELISHDTYNSREASVLVGTAEENKEEAYLDSYIQDSDYELDS